VGRGAARYRVDVFFFFSSGIGCLGSIVLSIVLTLILMAIF
jgi:hypothetical protein